MNLPPPSIYPQDAVITMRNHPHPVLLEIPHEEALCNNCGGKGFLVAFFAAYAHTAPVGKIPFHSKSQVIKWAGKAWLVGENKVYRCPVCQ